MMRRIHQQAHQVIIWLGKQKDDGEDGIFFAHRLREAPDVLARLGRRTAIDMLSKFYARLAT